MSAVYREQADESGRYPGNQDDVTKDPDGLGLAGCRCGLNQDEAHGDSDRGKEAERAGSDGVFGDPVEAGGRDEAGGGKGGDEQTEYEGESFHYVPLFAGA